MTRSSNGGATEAGAVGEGHPFLLYGIPVLVISFWLRFTPPVGANPVVLAVYFFVILEIFYFASTIV